MFYVTAFLFFLAIYFGISGFRQGSADRKGLAFAFFMAGIGTLIVMMFAFNALQGVSV